jgi:hypothetical protein
VNYTKPEVHTLGDAMTVIESLDHLKVPRQPFDPGKTLSLPAYELDV